MRLCALSLSTIFFVYVQVASAARVQVFPADFLILNPVNEARGYFDVMVPTVAIQTSSGEAFNVQQIRFEFLKSGRVLMTRDFVADDALTNTKDLAGQPVPGLIDAQFIAAGGYRRAMGEVQFAASTMLRADQVLMLTERYFTLDDAPDTLILVASGTDAAKRNRVVRCTVPIRRYHSPIRYKFPLKGNWLSASTPSVMSHHRFNAPAEFAIDFFKVDAEGHDYRGDGVKAEEWYAYGQPVSAAADGEVVNVLDDQLQDRTVLVDIPGESGSQRATRIRRTTYERLFGKGARFPDSITGNTITIKHQIGGVMEFSSYGHLKPGSIRVKKGEMVKQGDVIAEVGDTGDTAVAHLHFQVNAGPDPFMDKSLPFEFSDIKWAGATRDPGHFIEPAP